MALANDLQKEVQGIFSTKWEERDGSVVPEPDSVTFGNDAVRLDGTVLYADLAQSTALVNGYKPWFAAEIYKAYLRCAARIIGNAGGTITAYDGDRIMAVFIGGRKNTSAAKCALQINWAVLEVINPAIKEKYPKSNYVVSQAVGVDTSSLFVAKTGIRGSNDLVWVGRAANYAAKLCELRAESYASWITESVFNAMKDEAKFTNGKSMWEERTWAAKGITVYRSHWKWSV